MSDSTHGAGPGRSSNKVLAGMALGALGVVYGDIGTSPLYALKECFAGSHGVPLTRENILGVLSLVFWSLNFLISYKYIGHMMRADNRGEGGILALIALLNAAPRARNRTLLFAVGLFGAALLYGDGIITPAISVLGAVEGLGVATQALEPWVVYISLVIIIALFAVQKHGTSRVGAMFGPVTVVWFLCITILGLVGIARAPSVLAALNPWHGVSLLFREGVLSFGILAAVVLVVTGGEALYADMGHFGRKPIRLAWFGIVLPALVINYFGQGALLISNPEAIENPFYSLVPSWFLYPMVVIATGAAITASQALISGAYSLTQQALQLGYSPRVTIRHTSRTTVGQIYIPQVNTLLAVACCGLILGFRNTTNLAGTYGVAVTGTMTITSILFGGVARYCWNWSVRRVLLVVGPILVVDLAFMGANLTKITHGGWFPILVATIVYILMSTWKRGRTIVSTSLRESTLPHELFIPDIARRNLPRVPGTAVFLTSDASGAPPVLLHHIKHNKVLHQRVIIMSFTTENVPHVPTAERLDIRELGEGFWAVVGRYGFMETPDMDQVRALLGTAGLQLSPGDTSYYLGRETLFPTGPSKMARWRKKLFILMSRNAQSASAYFGLPPNRVVELGAQIQL